MENARVASDARGRRRLVIVGGGASGVAAFAAAVRFGVAQSIDIVDPLGIGQGVAFSALDPALLCNTSVETMSMLDDDPDDFRAYLLSIGVSVSRDAFVPRRYVSGYLVACHARFSQQARDAGIDHRLVRAGARHVERMAAGGYRCWLDDDTALDATDVLVCTGNGESAIPEPVKAHVGAPRIFARFYPEGAVLAQLAPQSRVLVLGSRLTAVDAALLLCRSGHSIVIASPSGRLPAVRTATTRVAPVPVDTAAYARLDLNSSALSWRLMRIIARSARAVRGRALRDQVVRLRDPVERLRREVTLARDGATHWQHILVANMDAAEARLRSEPLARQKLAIDACSRAMGRYLFACPLGNGEKLLGFVEQGRLRVQAGVPAALHEVGGRWRIDWQDGASETYDAVVCATGFQKAPLRASEHALALSADADVTGGVPRVSHDLRVWLAGAARPERIWTLGVASYAGAPLINAVYQAARQAGELCRRWRADDERLDERNTVATEAG
ncbi:FAD/NAD(P)-binding protein [Burkholderia sp. SCN-KJ]|uniref:FAD/NAD(P)-binding protein n=1 Tax=Burkholderia sp. SCN-KJ TaxID=2969248 RepID=UPI00215030CB|nr:FAD/NAD(P)-binding protein [Burkholderia sp. SCN-KJ]MCR4465370.1 FAD/NAD(P)-binding protein [Burkholderia sp. SCN-KJ]